MYIPGVRGHAASSSRFEFCHTLRLNDCPHFLAPWRILVRSSIQVRRVRDISWKGWINERTYEVPEVPVWLRQVGMLRGLVEGVQLPVLSSKHLAVSYLSQHPPLEGCVR